ncbi:hypothetical protein CHLRE_16g660024v5 [Chlamydomonas reinhardtii]|uniref:KANL3/Tex30 alpha/beta hydrolase-like domain-containing protein n=1 Tax=Chlamydomonas reinhardtii TaxID=3055 RepID=A0A2K3CTH3_CHLRE|nr:uncharacterized protein CHLRE_16g660024v5 [Chlamydomonas reinhardtii]PNW71578.1 hypothetical protein CHLRE_16g660024v5 [Chlamydomonas reinhardtii]
MDSGYLPLLAAQLAAAGFACVRFTCKPPHLPTRTAAFQAVLRAAATEWPETRGVRRWFVAGHSMGGRAACEVAHSSWHQHQDHQQQQQQQQQYKHGSNQRQDGLPAQSLAQAAAGAGTDACTDTGAAEPATKRPRSAASGDGASAGARVNITAPAAAEAQGAGASEEQQPHEHQHGGQEHEAVLGELDAAAGVLATAAAAAAPERRRGPARAGRAGSGPAAQRATKELKEAGGGEGSGSRGDCGGAAGPETARQEPKQARGAKRSKQASVARISDAAKRGEGAGAVSEAALPRVQGCVLLSYPLHPPDKPTELRDRPLVGLRLPVLFVRGSRDAFSLPEQQWEEVLGRMRQAGCDSLQVHTVEGGDHGLAVPKSLLRAAAAAAAATAAAATATADTATATATAIGSGRVGKGKRAGARQEPKQGTTVQGSGSAGQVAMALEAGGSDGGKSGAEGTATPVDAAIRAVVGWLAEQCSGCAAGASV